MAYPSIPPATLRARIERVDDCVRKDNSTISAACKKLKLRPQTYYFWKTRLRKLEETSGKVKIVEHDAKEISPAKKKYQRHMQGVAKRVFAAAEERSRKFMVVIGTVEEIAAFYEGYRSRD